MSITGECLSPYQRCNLDTLAVFLKSNCRLLSNEVAKRYFSFFLDDACSDLSGSVAFSPPAGRGNVAIVDPITINGHFYISRLTSFHIQSRPYSDRIEKAYWRGALTGQVKIDKECNGNDYVDKLYSHLQRIALCRYSSQEPELLDFKITSATQWLYNELIEERLTSCGFYSRPDPFEKNFEFKYLIDIDGNSNSWPGFFMKLASGSCVFKVASPDNFYQWYYKHLTPWKHYVPVMADMSDLTEKIHYIKNKPELGFQIACNSLAFILEKTSRDWTRLAIQDFCLSLEMMS